MGWHCPQCLLIPGNPKAAGGLTVLCPLTWELCGSPYLPPLLVAPSPPSGEPIPAFPAWVGRGCSGCAGILRSCSSTCCPSRGPAPAVVCPIPSLRAGVPAPRKGSSPGEWFSTASVGSSSPGRLAALGSGVLEEQESICTGCGVGFWGASVPSVG